MIFPRFIMPHSNSKYCICLHSSNLRIILSHPQILAFVSLSWCHIIQARSHNFLALVEQKSNCALHLFSGTLFGFFFLFFCSWRTHLWQFASQVSFWLNLTLCFTFFSAVCGRNLCPPHIYNSLRGCSSTSGCQTIQMRHHRSPFSSTLQATVFTVQSQWLTL